LLITSINYLARNNSFCKNSRNLYIIFSISFEHKKESNL